MSVFMTIHPTTKRPKDWPEYKKYSPSDFEEGTYVRLYHAYFGRSTIEIREGVVINTCNDQKGPPTLELRVLRRGILMRDEPESFGVENAYGHIIYGHPEISDVIVEYRKPFIFERITRAEISRQE